MHGAQHVHANGEYLKDAVAAFFHTQFATQMMRRSRTVLDPKYFSNIHTEYEIGGILGKGAFGVVRLAVHRMTGERYAVKSISKARLITETEAEALRREIQILFFLTPHETLAGIKCVFEDQFYVHIVMELCSGGELFEHIISRGTLTEKEAAQFFQQMVEMVGHCHACQVMHRDIKPENFLLSDRSEQARLLACDFGLGTYFQPDKMLTEIVGSPYYVAPEVLRQQYGPQADVWSLGVVLYILLSGVPPFWGPTDKEIFTAVLRGEVSFDCPPWPQISESAKDLICKLLEVNPQKRIKIGQILEHPWLKEQGIPNDMPLDSVVLKRMKEFCTMSKMKKAAVFAAARYLRPEEIQGLQELFKSFDTNNDGVISLDELRAGLREHSSGMKITDDEVRFVLQEADIRGSGDIDYSEFIAATVNLALLEREDVMAKLFEEIDLDNSGTLTVEEIEAALARVVPDGVQHQQVLEFVRMADINGDGVIDFEEFKALWQRLNRGDVANAAKSFKKISASML